MQAGAGHEHEQSHGLDGNSLSPCIRPCYYHSPFLSAQLKIQRNIGIPRQKGMPGSLQAYDTLGINGRLPGLHLCAELSFGKHKIQFCQQRQILLKPVLLHGNLIHKRVQDAPFLAVLLYPEALYLILHPGYGLRLYEYRRTAGGSVYDAARYFGLILLLNRQAQPSVPGDQEGFRHKLFLRF